MDNREKVPERRTVGQTWCPHRQQWVVDIEGQRPEGRSSRLVQQTWNHAIREWVTTRVVDTAGPVARLKAESALLKTY